MTRCLVLGGNGFIGSHIAEALCRCGFDVHIFDSRDGLRPDITGCSPVHVKGDFLNDSDIQAALEGVDIVFHFISTTSPGSSLRSPVYDIQSNVISTVRLLEHCCDAGVKKVVFPSSGGTVYGEPTSIPIRESDPVSPVHPYAISKVAIEMYLRSFSTLYGLDYLILRYSNPYGERQMPFGSQGVIPIFLAAIMEGKSPVVYGDGSMLRDYIYIGDLVEGTLALLQKNTSEKIFNVGSGEGTSVHDLLEIMEEVLCRPVLPVFSNPPGMYISRIVLDISRITACTGWRPEVSLHEGIERTSRWMQTHLFSV